MKRPPLTCTFPRLPLPADIVAWAKNPVEQMEMWSDLKRTRDEIREIAAHIRSTPPMSEAPVALICSLTTDIFQIKLEAMLAWGLVLEGWDVRILLRRRRDRWTHRYFLAYGLDRFVYWEDEELSAEVQHESAAAAERLLNKGGTFMEVKEWSYHDCWIGPQILASVSRGMMEGSPDPADPAVKDRIRKVLPRTLEAVHKAESLFERVHPQLCTIIEPNYAIRGAITDTAVNKGINMIQVADCDRDDALAVKRLNKITRRTHPYSMESPTFERVLQEPWTDTKQDELDEIMNKRYDGSWFLLARNQQNVERFDHPRLTRELELDPKKKIAVLFSVILWDANLFYGEDLFRDNGEWFVESVKAACANDRLNWIIKLHPANIWKRQREQVIGEYNEIELIRDRVGQLENLPGHVRLLLPESNISTYSLFQLLDVGITVRGSVCMEVPCFGKPILTAGTGRASGLGFTVDSKTREEYLQRLAMLPEIEGVPDGFQEKSRQYSHAMLTRRPWVFHSFKTEFRSEEKGRQALGKNLRSSLHTIRQFQEASDLRRWARWAGDRNQVDYLA